MRHSPHLSSSSPSPPSRRNRDATAAPRFVATTPRHPWPRLSRPSPPPPIDGVDKTHHRASTVHLLFAGDLARAPSRRALPLSHGARAPGLPLPCAPDLNRGISIQQSGAEVHSRHSSHVHRAQFRCFVHCPHLLPRLQLILHTISTHPLAAMWRSQQQPLPFFI